jgi:hypothetical protein
MKIIGCDFHPGYPSPQISGLSAPVPRQLTTLSLRGYCFGDPARYGVHSRWMAGQRLPSCPFALWRLISK